MLPYPSPATLGTSTPALEPVTCGMLCSHPQRDGFDTVQTVTMPLQRRQRTYLAYGQGQADGQVSVDISFTTKDMC